MRKEPLMENLNRIIDLRSDTVSKPTEEMRMAIFNAEVGDDCFGDDITTKHLESYCSEFFGKEASLFTTSGTLSNQIAIKTFTNPGDEVLLHRSYHVNFFESAATSTFSGVNFNLIDTEDGTFNVEDLVALESTKARWNSNYALPKLIILENTVGSKAGTVFPIDNIIEISKYARSIGAKLYLDGARIWNASVAADVDLKTYAKYFDALAVCFSKGLGAPVGSILMGDQSFISEARKYRKWFGGDMHQSGIVSSGALYAIQNNLPKIKQDHENMRFLYDSLKNTPGIKCIYRNTNIMYLDSSALKINPKGLAKHLEQKGILCLPWDGQYTRFITHLNITAEDICLTAQEINNFLTSI